MPASSPKCSLGHWVFCWDKPTNTALAGFCDPVTFLSWVLCPSSAGIFAFWLGRTFFFLPWLFWSIWSWSLLMQRGPVYSMAAGQAYRYTEKTHSTHSWSGLSWGCAVPHHTSAVLHAAGMHGPVRTELPGFATQYSCRAQRPAGTQAQQPARPFLGLLRQLAEKVQKWP